MTRAMPPLLRSRSRGPWKSRASMPVAEHRWRWTKPPGSWRWWATSMMRRWTRRCGRASSKKPADLLGVPRHPFSHGIPFYKTGNSYYAFGVDPHYERLYFEKYIKFDPLNAVYLTLAVGDVISNSNIIPHAEFIDTRFYKEWAQPQGWIDNVIASLEKSSTSIAAFVVFRHATRGPCRRCHAPAHAADRAAPASRSADRQGGRSQQGGGGGVR